MSSFRTAVFALIAGCGWLIGTAGAQTGADSSQSLLPLPSVLPTDSITASYNAMPGVLNPPGTVFSAHTPEVIPNPTPGTPSTLSAQNRTAFEDAVHSGLDGGDCGCDTCEPCCAPCYCGWFGGLGGIVMGRNRPNPYWTTFESGNNVNQLMNTTNAGANWTGGWQVTGGYMFGLGAAGAGAGCASGCANPCGNPCGSFTNCGCNDCCGHTGIGFTYWGLAPMTGNADLVSSDNTLSTPINLQTQTGDVMIGNRPAGDFFDNAHEHRINREDRVNSFELNLYRTGFGCGNLQVIGLAGFRYFRFDEQLDFSSVQGGFNFGDDGGRREATMGFRTINNLYGFQIGFYANYMVTQRLGLFVGPKVGVFGNQMISTMVLQRGDGLIARGYDIHASKTDFSMLAELDTGVSYFFRPNLFAYVGYRLVGLSNLALADNQFLPFLADRQGFGEIKQSGSLILQGAMIGGGFLF